MYHILPNTGHGVQYPGAILRQQFLNQSHVRCVGSDLSNTSWFRNSCDYRNACYSTLLQQFILIDPLSLYANSIQLRVSLTATKTSRKKPNEEVKPGRINVFKMHAVHDIGWTQYQTTYWYPGTMLLTHPVFYTNFGHFFGDELWPLFKLLQQHRRLKSRVHILTMEPKNGNMGHVIRRLKEQFTIS